MSCFVISHRIKLCSNKKLREDGKNNCRKIENNETIYILYYVTSALLIGCVFLHCHVRNPTKRSFPLCEKHKYTRFDIDSIF